MDQSFQHGINSQLPPTSDLYSHGPNFLTHGAHAELHLDTVESLLTASNTFSDMDEDDARELTASLSMIRTLLSPEGRLRATRENVDADPRGNRAMGTRGTAAPVAPAFRNSEPVVGLTSGATRDAVPANMDSRDPVGPLDSRDPVGLSSEGNRVTSGYMSWYLSRIHSG